MENEFGEWWQQAKNSSADYNTKYPPQLADKEEEHYEQFDTKLEETESNDRRFKDAEEEHLFSELDTWYGYPGGPDRKLVFGWQYCPDKEQRTQ